MTMYFLDQTNLWRAIPHEPAWRADAREQLRLTLVASEHPLARFITGQAGRSEAPISEEMRAVEAELEYDFFHINALHEVSLRIQSAAGMEKFPATCVLVKNERSPSEINPDVCSATSIRKATAILAALADGLKITADKFTGEEHIGLVLCCAIQYGGLLDRGQLRALVSAAGSIQNSSGWPEIRLTMDWQQQRAAEERQWFCDPRTLVLLLRRQEDFTALGDGDITSSFLWRCIRAFLRLVRLAIKDQPASLGEYLELARLNMQWSLPPVIVAYAARRRFLSQSIKPGVWHSMHGGQYTMDQGVEDDDSLLQLEADQSNVSQDQALDPSWLAQISGIVIKLNASEAIKNLSDLDLPQLSIADTMRHWLKHMLKFGSKYARPVSSKVLRDSLHRVARGLIQELSTEESSLVSLPEPALTAVYEALIEEAQTISTRRKMSWALRQLHHFLTIRYHLPPINEVRVLGSGLYASGVDASVISEEQFQSALTWLRKHSKIGLRHPDLIEVAQLMLILGYRAGLRRNEALKLRIKDVHVSLLPPELLTAVQERCLQAGSELLDEDELCEIELPLMMLIRPHFARRLKSRSSTRIVPLHVLLQPAERKLLESWWFRRMAESGEATEDSFLFHIPSLDTQWVSEEFVFPLLHQALRAVTGNPYLRYHHLRHSCATWLCLKLMTPLLGVEAQLPRLFPLLPKTVAQLQNNKSLMSLYCHADGGPTRKAVHIVSALLGHASPKVSLEHYIHCLSWLQAMSWQWVDWRLPKVDELRRLAGLNSTPEKKTDTHQQLMDLIFRLARKRGIDLKGNGRAKKQSWQYLKDDVEQVDRHREARLLSLERLLLVTTHSRSLQKIIDLGDFLFSPQQQASSIAMAEYIRQMKPDRSGSIRSLHRMQALSSQPGQHSASLCPKRPETKDWPTVVELSVKLNRLLEGPSQDRVLTVLKDFSTRSRRGNNVMIFHLNLHAGESSSANSDCIMAAEYKWFFRQLDLSMNVIEYLSFDLSKRSSVRSKWREILNLSKRTPFVKLRPASMASKGEELGLRVRLHDSVTKAPLQFPGNAWRYLLLMTLIEWSGRSEVLTPESLEAAKRQSSMTF